VNLSTIGHVLWKQRVLMVLGVIAAVGVSLASSYRIEDGRLAARVHSEYASRERLLVQNMSVFQSQTDRTVVPPQTATSQPAQVSTLNGMSPSQLAAVYSYVIGGDEVTSRVRRSLGLDPSDYSVSVVRRSDDPGVQAGMALDVGGSSEIPVLEITAKAHDPALARRVAAAVGDTFIGYVNEQQNAASIAADQRIGVSVLNAADTPTRTGRSPLITEVLVGLGVLLAFMGIAFARHNARESRHLEAVDVRDRAGAGVPSGAIAGPEPS